MSSVQSAYMRDATVSDGAYQRGGITQVVATLTVADAARELGLTPQGVRNAIRSGALAAAKAILSGRSPRKPIYMISASDMERYRALLHDEPGGWNRGHDPEEDRRMAEAGYLSVTAAAREIHVAPGYLSRLVKRGEVPAVRKHITFIHRDTVALLKAERDRQFAE